MQRKNPQLLAAGFDGVNKGDEAYATRLCQKCFNKHLQAKEEKPLTNVQWRQVVEKKAYRGKDVENDGERTIFAWDVGRNWPTRKRQAGIQGQWQQESPAREYLEQVKCSHDTDRNEPMMKKGLTALKNGTCEEDKETFRKNIESHRMGLRQD